MTNFEYTKKDTLLKIENVCLTLGGNVILRDVNIEIKDIIRPNCTQGQIVSLLAPSGMGKTQLFEIIAGLKKPTSGRVLVGNPLKEVCVGEIGVVAQNYPLFIQYTVEDNLMLAVKKNKEVPEEQRKDKVENMLSMFNLTEHKDKYPAILSGGQKQRVAIAQQILCSNYFLLLDEPFSGLDVIMLNKVSDLVIKISNVNELNTVILVTHDVDSAVRLSDTIWLMGRDRDTAGNIIPGAKIKHTFDLIEKGIAWRDNNENTPEFVNLVKEIKSLYPTL